MAILPSHRVLDRDVEIPERVALRNLDAAPHERISSCQDNEELVDEVWALGGLADFMRLDVFAIDGATLAF